MQFYHSNYLYSPLDVDLCVSVLYTDRSIDCSGFNFTDEKGFFTDGTEKYGIKIALDDIESKKEIDPRIKNEIKVMKSLFDEYFSKKGGVAQKFYERITKNSDIYGKFTLFQSNVYKELCSTQIGQQLSYKELAQRISSTGNAPAYRAVGNTMRNNRFPILIPCHRVISSDLRTIGGFGGVKSSKIKGGNYFTSLKGTDYITNNQIPTEIKLKILLLKFERN